MKEWGSTPVNVTFKDQFIRDAVCVKAVGNEAWKVGVLLKKTIGNNYVETYTYQGSPLYNNLDDAGLSGEGFVRTEFGVHQNPGNNSYVVRRTSKTVIADGATYGEEYSDFDWFGSPGTVIKTGPTGAVTRAIAYKNDLVNNIIGLVERDDVSVGRPGPTTGTQPVNCSANPAACR